MVGFCSALFLAGFGLKAAIVPFHSWLPDAHPSAPAPISAMLSGVLIKVSGVYAMTRIFLNVFGLTPALTTVLTVLGIVSIFVGALAALGQNDIKRMLAYSSISQIGYVVLGLGIGTPLGILGGLFHLFNHALFKSLLFLNAGAIEQSTGTRSLDKMGGLAKRMPLTAATIAIGFAVHRRRAAAERLLEQAADHHRPGPGQDATSWPCWPSWAAWSPSGTTWCCSTTPFSAS